MPQLGLCSNRCLLAIRVGRHPDHAYWLPPEAFVATCSSIGGDSVGQKRAAWQLQNCRRSVIVSIGAPATFHVRVISRGAPPCRVTFKPNLRSTRAKLRGTRKPLNRRPTGRSVRFIKGWLVTATSLRRISGRSSQSGPTHLWQPNDIAPAPLEALPRGIERRSRKHR